MFILKRIKEPLFIIIGTFIMAGASYFFLHPYNLAPGGVYGTSVVLTKLLPGDIPIGNISLALNVLLFAIAFKVLGPSYGSKSILGALGYSFGLIIWENLFPVVEPVTGDILMDVLASCALSAMGLVLVLNQEASTGGTDIAAEVLRRYTPLDFGKALMIIDAIITIAASLVFGIRVGLYSIFAVVIYSSLVDYLLDGFNRIKTMTIVSHKNDEILDYIIKDLDRSATIYFAKGAYTKQEKEVISTTMDIASYIKLKNFIKDLDPTAFITVSDQYEVLGEGYSYDKINPIE